MTVILPLAIFGGSVATCDPKLQKPPWSPGMPGSKWLNFSIGYDNGQYMWIPTNIVQPLSLYTGIYSGWTDSMHWKMKLTIINQYYDNLMLFRPCCSSPFQEASETWCNITLNRELLTTLKWVNLCRPMASVYSSHASYHHNLGRSTLWSHPPSDLSWVSNHFNAIGQVSRIFWLGLHTQRRVQAVVHACGRVAMLNFKRICMEQVGRES